MPRFVYQARDSQGERISGAREAATQQDALQALREAGFFVTKLLAENSKEAKELFPEGAPIESTPARNPASATSLEDTQSLPSRKWELAPQIETPSSRPMLSTQGAQAVAPSAPFSKTSEHSRTPAAPRRGETLSGFNPQSASTLAATQERVENAAKPKSTQPSSNAVDDTETVLPAQAAQPLSPRYHLRSNPKDLSLFWSQMHSMLHAGVPISHAISTMGENAPNAGLRAACREIAPRLSSGTPLSELMGAYPGIFTPLAIGMIRAGEAGGFLDRMCKRLGEYAERDYHIQQTIKRETWYPKLVFVVALLIPTIIPAAVAAFTGKGNFFLVWLASAKSTLLLFLFIAIVIRFKNYLTPLTKHLTPFTLLIDQVKLLIPISGRTTRALATAKFCRALGALQAAGMGVRQTINLAADACGNSVIAASSRGTLTKLEAGASMTEALESTRQFPGIAIQMLRTGEATGSYEEQLDKVADFLETDAETTIKQSVVVLGIVAFLAIAIYVAITVIQMYVGTYTGIIDQGLDLQN